MSGMWAVVVTDMFTNVIFIVVAVCVLPITIMSVGGREAAFEAVSQAGIWSATGDSGLDMTYFIGYALAWLAIIGGSPHLVNLTLILEERKSVFKGTMVAFIMVVTLSVMLFLAGAILNASIPHNSDIIVDSITPLAAKDVWPAWLGILVLGGAMAAAYTTASSQIMTTSLGIVDIFRFLKKERPDDKTLIRYTKITALIVLVIVGLVAGTDLWIMAIASSLAGIISSLGIFPTLLVSMYWNGVTRKAAKIMLWSSVPIGLFMIVCNTAFGWFAPFPTIYSYPIGFGGLILVSLLTKQDSHEKESAIRFKQIAFAPETISIQKVDYAILVGAMSVAVIMYILVTRLIGLF
jgi:Na+/proline symporter